MTDFLTDRQQEIKARCRELEPVVREYQRLEAALQALSDIPVASPRAPAAAPNGRRRGPGRPRGANKTLDPAKPRKVKGTKADAPRKSRGRRKGSGKRSAQALALVRATPGITIPELASKTGAQQSYLYRVLPGLEQEGLVKKEGRGWHPTDTPASV